MNTVIYAKCTYDRKAEYQICTKIVQADDGKKCVVKHALNTKALPHIRSLKDKYEILTLNYSGVMKIVPMQLQDSFTAVFPFVKGEKLSDIINRYIVAGEKEKAFSILEHFITDVFTLAEEKEYQTPEFQQIFGRPMLPDKMMVLQPANIDLIFDNVICESERFFQLIDYEWCFPFSVPLEFILFRSIMLLPAMEHLSQDEQKRVWELVSVPEERKEIYYNMELAFQEYVYGTDRKLSDLYLKMDRHNYSLGQIEGACQQAKEYGDAYAKEVELREKYEQVSRENYQAYQNESEARKQYEAKSKEYYEAYQKELEIRKQYEGKCKEFFDAYQIEAKRREELEKNNLN